MTDLGTVALKITDGAHKTPTYVERGVPFFSVKDFSAGELSLANTRFIPESEHIALYQRCDPKRGEILIGRIGTLGKAVLIETDVEFSLFVSVGLIRFDHASVAPLFLRLLMNSPFVEEEFNRIKVGGGTHTNKLNLGDLHSVALPLPPLAEQRRIVAKVDELMALCDRLEEARTAREAVRDRLTAASLARLTAPEATAADFQSHARFALQTLLALTTRPDQIKPLRQTILKLAVRGKLVKQGQSRSLEEDQAALMRIEAERLAVSQNNSDEKRVLREFSSLRDAWNASPTDARRITTFCACNFITKGTTPSKNNLLEKGEIPFLKVYNIVQNELDFAYRPAFISRETHESSLGRSRVRPNDVIMNIVGPPLGKVAIVTDEYLEWNINQALSFFRPLTAFSSAYIALMLKAPESLKEILGETRGTVGQDNLSLEQVRSISFPFIPLAEQHRIVAKVDALMALCDRLEASLTTADTTRQRLLTALLHEALNPAEKDLKAAE